MGRVTQAMRINWKPTLMVTLSSLLATVSNAGFGHLQKGHGISFSDLDNDGDQDVYHSLGGFVKADGFWNMLLMNIAPP